MNVSAEQLEWIVQEVIRRLRLLDGNEPAGGELRLTERVVTLATLHGRLPNIRRVIVLSRAIVTHAVRDELKQKKIELVREGAR